MEQLANSRGMQGKNCTVLKGLTNMKYAKIILLGLILVRSTIMSIFAQLFLPFILVLMENSFCIQITCICSASIEKYYNTES